MLNKTFFRIHNVNNIYYNIYNDKRIILENHSISKFCDIFFIIIIYRQ